MPRNYRFARDFNFGTAYTLGYVFDPLNIECISMIPFYRIIPRKEVPLLQGANEDPSIEEPRFSLIEADEYEAAAFENDSKEAATLPVANSESAIAYGISSTAIRYLGEKKD